MAGFWDEQENELFSTKKKKDVPVASKFWDEQENELFNPKPKAGLTSSQVSSSIDRYQAGLYGVGEAVAGAVGAEGSKEWLQKQREENEYAADVAAKRARELGAVDEWKNVNSLGEFGSYAKSLAIQSLPYAGEAIVGGIAARGAMTGTRAALAAAEASGDVAAVAKAKKALNIGSTVGGTAASYPSSVGDVLSNQRDQNGTTNLLAAGALGVPYAALNAVGVESALMRGNLFKNSINLLDKGTGFTGAAARTAATATGTALKEGASETGQEMINQMGRMSVDDKAQLFSEEALDRYKESFIGGAVLGGVAGGTLGGWRRSGNDISQAISGDDQSKPPITTKQFTPPPPPPAPPALSAGVMSGLTGRGADPLAGRSTLVGGEPTPAPAPPAVAGGSTDIAQAQQQAQIESQQIQKAQAQQAAREQIYTNFGIADPTNPTKGNLFGKPLFGPSVPAVADAIGAATRTMSAYQLEVAQAINKANADTGGKLLNFQFNANDPTKSVQKAIEAVGKVANAFQISHVQTVEEAAQILNEQSNTLKGAKLEQLNAIHQALTGEDTSGYLAEQQSKTAKGAKNVQQPKLQTTTGLGEVPVQGTASQTVDGGGGNVRPAEVQPIGTGSLGAGSLGLQVGQPSAEGIRTSTGSNAAVDVRGNAPQNAQVGAQNAAVQNINGGGQVSGQPQQATPSAVGERPVQNGPRIYATPPQYYATDLSHIKGSRRIEVILDLLNKALAPKVTRKGVAQSAERVEMLRLALLEQFEAKEIAKLTGMTEASVQKQLERLGVNFDRDKGQWGVTDLEFAKTLVDTATAYRSVEFPDGIGEQELAALYATKYTSEDTAENQLEVDLLGEETKPEGSKLQEELGTKEKPEAQSMGVVDTFGGSQGAVDTSGDAFFAKVGKLQAQLDLASDAEKPAIQKKIDAAWAEYGKEQTKRGKTGEIEVKPSEEGEEDAVQEQGADEGDVRQPAGGGEEVVKTNAKPKKSAGARKAKPEVKPVEEVKQEVKTPEEQWMALADQFPGMPPYEGLTKDEKIRWDDVASRGVANLAAANTVLTTTVKAGTTQAPSATGTSEEIEGKFGKDGAVTEPYSVAELTKEISDFVRTAINTRRLKIVGSVKDLLMSADPVEQKLGAVLALNRAYGVATNGRAYLIADRISKGQGRAKFMHEVGVHLGVEGLLPDKQFDRLTDQIFTWAKRDDDSREAKLAKKAILRAETAGTPDEDLRSEILAYFVEEAMQSGIEPSAAMKLAGPLGQWFRTLYAAFKSAIRRLGMNPEKLNAQDVVNIAYGAARLEMSGTYHGTAADFRRFNHKYMGSGEGAQAYGWGTYLAQRFGIAKGYWTADVRRKEKDNYEAELNKFIGYKFDHDVIHPEDRTLAIYKGFKLTKTSVPAVARKLAQFGIDEVNLVAPDGVIHTVELGAPKGNVMRVDVGVDQNELLNWDSKLSKQPELLAKLEANIPEGLKQSLVDETNLDLNEMTGEDLYRGLEFLEKKEGRISEEFDVDDYNKRLANKKAKELVSIYLDEVVGIPGLKFYDAESRGKPENQIVFKGKKYTREDLINLKDELGPIPLNQITILRHVLRNGYAETIKELEQKLERNIKSSMEVTKETYAKFNFPYVEDKARKDAERIHEKSYEGEQIKFLKDNKDNISIVKDQNVRTRNLVIFNDKNIFRVGSRGGNERANMKFGATEQKPPRLEKRENGRVIDLIVDGQTAESFELASKGLWDRFGGDEEKILRGNDAQAAKQKAYEALRSAEYAYRQEGPLNRVEQIALDDLERGDLEGLRARMPLLFDGGQLRYDIGKLISHAVYNPDTPISASAPEAKYAPRWVLGQASRPAQPADELSMGTRRAPTRRDNMKFGIDAVLPAAATKPAKSVVTNIATAARNGLLSAAITEDVVNMAGKYMRSAKNYLDAQYARQKTRLEFEMRIERILEDFDKLPKNLQGTGAGSVNRYILDSTMQRKWGYYPGEERIGTQLFEADPDLAARFNAFPDDAQQLIKDVFEHGYTALDMKKTAVSKAVEREFAEREKAAIGDVDALADLQKERKAMVAKLSRLQNIDFTVPYAYLGRYGDYIVVAKSKEFKHWQERAELNDFDVKQAKAWLSDNSSNPDHYVVQFAETQGEADQLAAELIATGKFDMDGTEAGPKEAAASYIGDDLHLAVSRARNLANRQKGEGSEELDKLLGDLYLMTAAENSARKSEIARKYVYGANENMMRNLATSGRADAHFLSTMEHNDAITESLENMRNEARRNYKEAMPLYNELYTRQANSMDYKQPALLSQALTQATSLWFLSTSPAFYLQQILQTGVLSLPYMAGRLGYFRSARAIKTAYGDVAGLVKGLGVSEHVDFSKAPADVRGMLQTLVGMGKIDIGIDSDARSRAGEQGTLGKVVRKLQGVNNRIETINRATAAIAAYRGYLQRFGANNTEAATKFAAEVVSNSHGSYDGFNTPRVLASDIGRVVGQFKRFQIIQLSMLAKLIHTSFKGASAEEKMVARRALAFITGHMAVLGGALGVPFVMQIGNLLTNLFGDDDEPKDFEYKLRQAIGDKALADLLLNGVPAAMGVNLGGKLGMGNVASILPFTDVDLSSRSGYEKVMVGMMGPFFGGLAPKFIDGAGMITQGEYYKGLELLMPNGIGNAMKGVRYATEGITMRNGDVVMKPEDISIVDAAFQAVGLPTMTITGRQYTQRTKVEFDKFYADKAAEIKGAYVDANRDGDSAGMSDARKDWENLQASRRRNGYKIQPMSELFMAVTAASKRQRSVVNGVETTKANKQFVANII